MAYPELLLRRDHGYHSYRMKCRFAVEAYPNPRFLERAKHVAAEAFVKHMAMQGWTYLDKYGFKMTGPYPAVQSVTLPRRSQQERWHEPSAKIMAAVAAGARYRAPRDGLVSTVPLLGETDKWDYELVGVFVRKTIMAEVPDSHEEEEKLRG